MAGRVHLINPSTKSFGVAVITPRWLYVVASATGTAWGDPIIVDETLDPITLTVAVTLMLTVAILAGWLPARRASRLDPMVALRHE